MLVDTKDIMRKVTPVLVLLLAACFAAIWLAQNRSDSVSREFYTEVAQYMTENDGKIPKAASRPNDWFYMQRAYPYTSIPTQARLDAAEQARKLARESAAKGAKSVVWAEAGPKNIPGRITDLAVHPSEPEVIYVASAAGGVFKSTDFGNSWTAVFDSTGVQSIGAIAIHPYDPDILYVGTGEANTSGDSYEGTGIYKTDDGGASWTYVGLPESYHIGRIVIDPMWPETVYVAAAGKLFGTNPERGVYRSTNGGANWEQILHLTDSTAAIDLALHPSTGTLFAAMWERWRNPRERRVGGWSSGLYRSLDRGDNWSLLSGGLPAPADDLGRIGVSVDPESNTVYAIYCDHPGDFMGVYRSTDLGDTWTRTNDGALDGILGGFGWYFGQIRVAPGSPDVVFALGVYMFRSVNGGNSWSYADWGIHVDHHALQIQPSDHHQVYGGCDGGVNYTVNGGDSWTTYVDMHNTQFYAITIDQQNPQRLYGGTQDNGTMRTLTGATDDWDRILGGDGFYVIVDPTDPDVIYAEYQWGYLSKSTDGGYGFDYAMDGIDYYSDRHNWNTPIAIDPSNHNTLYYGSQRLYQTTNGAGYWSTISGDLTDGDDPGNLTFGTITTIDVAATDGDVIYVGTDDANVWVTLNGGGDWLDRSGLLPNRWVTRVAVDPRSAGVAYVTFSGYREGEYLPHIFRSTNYGETWRDISGNLPDAPVNDVIVDPLEDSTLYIGTDFGVFITENLGQSWSMLGTGLPLAPVHDLAYHVPTRKLVAGTHGRSMYSTTIAGSPDDTDGDGVADTADNCPDDFNPDQTDTDFDGLGDSCDLCTDTDGDGYGNPGYPANTCDEDNCPMTYNPDQSDVDNDAVGDSCDTCTDSDGDGYGDPGFPANLCETDNCPDTANADQTDTDGDGVGDACCCIDGRGNVDGDQEDIVNIVDITSLVAYLFGGGEEPPCPAEANVDGDTGQAINIVDLTHLVTYLFGAGPEPAACP